MLAKLFTYSLFGIDANAVEVEVDISPGALPKTILVGLAEAAVKESTHRVERALVNSGYMRPSDRIVINLSPADMPKDAPSFDLPIALGLLVASGQLQSDRFDDYAAVGELALDGTLRPIKGSLSMALSARDQGKRGLLVPIENAEEAGVVDGIDVFQVGSLAEAVGFYTGELDLSPVEFHWNDAINRFGHYDIDFADVKGQEMAKRAATLPEFNRRTLEVLRQPLEENCVTISRAVGSANFPANLMLVAAMNPCPCGYRGDPKRQCKCNPLQIERYLARISGPLLDRIDIHVEVPPVPFRELSNDTTGTNSEQMRAQVVVARDVQRKRFAGRPMTLNGKMTPRDIRKYCKLESDAENLLKTAMEEMGLSARAHDKILRIGRTIADLEGSDRISAGHLSEAINYRTLDRSYWA
eukprot:g8364.t1